MTSYFIAIEVTLDLTGTLNQILSPEILRPTGPEVFSIAGFLGALIFNLALLLLLSPEGALRLCARAAAWALAGAFLGFLSSELSDVAGPAVAAIVGVRHTEMGVNQHDLAMYSAYLIWQTGMAFLVPLMLPHGTLEDKDHELVLQRSPARLSAFGKLFFLGIFGTLVVYGCYFARDEYHAWKLRHKSALLRHEILRVKSHAHHEPLPPAGL
jgi:hypothetical protein